MKVMSSAHCEDVPRGRGLASMTSVEDTIAHGALCCLVFMSELPSMNQVSSREKRGK